MALVLPTLIFHTSASGKWAVDFFIHNIEDKEILTGGFVGASSNGGGYNVWYMEPMNGGLSQLFIISNP